MAPADAERVVVDFLTSQIATLTVGAAPTVGVQLPQTWTDQSPPHLAVAVDDVDMDMHPVAATSAVRVVAWHSSTTQAKRMAALALGVLCDGTLNARAVQGPVADRDPDNGAPIATVRCAVVLRSSVI